MKKYEGEKRLFVWEKKKRRKREVIRLMDDAYGNLKFIFTTL
jgi:hypothetical protein